uniref:Nudix hydrolase domain-containing protein n=1 Tax=Cryptomonas curvata TaxID=233186 RepID=A0A7S0QTJ3_9CRYP|mmetsp:Transcript_52023/g.108650  ORF Transcript_52023/g.108650 Transcript_52023/m.108650 type:complete len:181 (+) Transcript_52023:174-716(+)
MRAFKDWCGSLDPEFLVKSILVQSVDMFGPRVGFLKFKAEVSGRDGKVVPNIVFMRGASVAVLVVIRCDEDGELFTILTVQTRLPTGKYRFQGLPAGMMDENGDFVGIVANEMKEKTGIKVCCRCSCILCRFVPALSVEEPSGVDWKDWPALLLHSAVLSLQLTVGLCRSMRKISSTWSS